MQQRVIDAANQDPGAFIQAATVIVNVLAGRKTLWDMTETVDTDD